MKEIPMTMIEAQHSYIPEDRLELLEFGTRFRFGCHPGVKCFTECCRDLRLMLTPYDTLRLKGFLELSFSSFIDCYTSLEFREPSGFPMLYLNMKDNERRSCPFVTPYGCSVYDARPSACRMYPVVRATRYNDMHKILIETFFMIKEDHCLGFCEPHLWKIEEWLSDQGLDLYRRYNDEWTRIVMHRLLKKGLSRAQRQFMYALTYDLDILRKIIESKKLESLFIFDEQEIEQCLAYDEALLVFGLKWLRFSLLGEPTMKVR